MSWLSRLFTNDDASSVKGICADNAVNSVNLSGALNANYELALKRNSPIISAISDRHRKEMRDIVWGEMGKDGIVDVETATSTKYLGLSQIAADFIIDLDIDGNCYLEQVGKVYRRVRPQNISWVDNDNLLVIRSGKQTAYRRLDDKFQSDSGTLLYHLRGGDVIDDLSSRGESPLLSIQNFVLMSIYAAIHNQSYLQNGMKNDMLITFENPLNEREFKEFSDKFVKTHTGAQNAGRPLLLTGVKSQVHTMQGEVKDMDFGNLQNSTNAAIALVYGYPLPLLDKSVQTYDNYNSALISFYRDSLLPVAYLIIEFLGACLGKEFKIDESKISALQTSKIAQSKDMATAGIYSINECRDIAGYAEVDGGEQIMRPANDIPIGDVGLDE